MPPQDTPVDFGRAQVGQDVQILLWKKHRTASIATVTASCFAAFVVFLLIYKVDPLIASLTDNDGSIIIAALPLFIPLIIEFYFETKIRKQLLEQVVQSMGYIYAPSAPVDALSGKLFEEGHSRNISDVILGTYKTYPFRMYTYSYVVGEGKSARQYSDTVFELTYSAALPYVLLWHEEPLIHLGLERVLLESDDFNEHFYLYTNDQLKVREILQPDLMAKLISDFSEYSLEIKDSKVYIVRSGFWSSKQDILDMQGAGDIILTNLLPNLRAASSS